MKDKPHNHWLILIVLALAQFMVVLDSSVVNVALPSILKSFSMTTSSLQWIVTAYTLTFGGFLLLGGRAADLYGRKKTFLFGVAGFGLISLLNGLSPSGTFLIATRALQGLAGAFMSPAALSIVLVSYKEGHERNIALSVWGSVAAGGAAAGVLLGGLLTEYFGWRWNFFINVPVSLGILYYASKIVPKHESEETHNDLDLPGAVSVTAGMMSIVYGLANGPSHGWTHWSTLIYFVVGVLLLTFFIFNERKVKNPLMPLSIFKIRNLTGANLTLFPVIASMFSMFFFMSLYVQDILKYSPVRAGLTFLVVPVMIAIAATNVPKIVSRIGARPVLITGPLLIAGALLYLTRIPLNGHYLTNILPALIMLGLGAGASFVSGTITATSGVSGRKSGLASGILNTTQQIGGSLGLAVLTGVASSAVTRSLSHLPANLAKNQIAAYAEVQGFHSAFLVGSMIAVFASIVAIFVIKPIKPSGNKSANPVLSH